MEWQNAAAHLAPAWARAFSLFVERGEGVYLYDAEGRRYLDCTSGIGVTNTGHAHPRVVEAIRAQAGRLLHGQVNILYTRPLLDLTTALRQVLPSSLDTFFFSNSGAEAVEAAVKLAKHATGRTNVIVFQGGFHGRTHLATAMTTSKVYYRARYQPLVPGIFVAPYPYPFAYGWDASATLEFCLHELKRLLKTQTAPEETACLVVEPVLGEGGYVVPPPEFLPALRALCDEHGILLAVDEIQTGVGRTGKFWAFEHAGITPDIVIFSKGIASGLPLSGVAAPRELMGRWKPGSHGGTFGGNVVACAAALATLEVLREERRLENAAARGAQLLAGLRALQADFPAIGEVRGLGLMTAVEFGQPGQPAAGMAAASAAAKAVQQAAFQRGLLLLTCGTYDNILRWIPPLVITEAQVREALDLFAAALDAAELPAR